VNRHVSGASKHHRRRRDRSSYPRLCRQTASKHTIIRTTVAKPVVLGVRCLPPREKGSNSNAKKQQQMVSSNPEGTPFRERDHSAKQACVVVSPLTPHRDVVTTQRCSIYIYLMLEVVVVVVVVVVVRLWACDAVVRRLCQCAGGKSHHRHPTRLVRENGVSVNVMYGRSVPVQSLTF
jgi:hypothetical protein